jgi:hypothetical protein
MEINLMLHFPSQESLDTLRYGIARAQQRLPYEIALSHLNGNSQAAARHQQSIQIAQDRLAWFEPHLPLIANVETFLIELPNVPSNRLICQQWRRAIDLIGDLTIPQSVIQQLALHCDLLAIGWPLIADTFGQINHFYLMGYQSKLIKDCDLNFSNQLERLWQNFFNLNNSSTLEEIKHCVKELSLIQIQLLEVN